MPAHGAAAVGVDGDVSVRLSRRARDAARAAADATLRGPGRLAASRRVADAAQSAPPTHRPREIRGIPREDQHRSLGCPHPHRRRGTSSYSIIIINHFNLI